MLVVYTCVFGEGFNLQPVEQAKDIGYVAFSDRPIDEGRGWKVVPCDPVFPDDLPRSSREQKVRPHRWLKEYDRSIYIDSSVVLKGHPEELWTMLMGDGDDKQLGLFWHSFRDSVSDEFDEVHRLGFEYPAVLASQLTSYLTTNPELLRTKPYWGGVIARRHLDPQVVDAMELWWAHILRFSRRDQLSLPLAVNQLPAETVSVSEESVFLTPFHQWPIPGAGRDESYIVKPFIRPWQQPKSAELTTSLDIPIRGHLTNSEELVRWNLRQLASLLVKEARSGSSEVGDDGIQIGGSASRHRIKTGRTRQNLHYVRDDTWPGRVFMSHPNRGSLYVNGVARRLAWLLRDYRIPPDIISPGALVVDVGANSGELGILCSRNGAEYVGIEPDPTAFRALRRNNPRASLYEVAVGAENGPGLLYLATAQADSSTIRPDTFDVTHQVELRTLDSLLRDLYSAHPITLLKIEAEGAEPEVLLGAHEVLQRTAFLAVDAGPEREGISTGPWVVDFLSTRGFELVDAFPLRGTFLFRSVTTP